ncbi:MAG: hypothetical protein R6U91_06565, partial [Bacillota bacterium]
LKQDHSKVRRENRLPSETTAKEDEPACVICARNCRPAPGEKSFCGLKEKNSKIMHHGSLSDRGIAKYYFDPLLTNCVANWACPAKSGSHTGKKNLTIFTGPAC